MRAYVKDYDGSLELLPLRFTSITDLVRTTIRCYEEGAYFLIEEGLDSDPLKEAEVAARPNPEVEYWRHRFQYVQANYV